MTRTINITLGTNRRSLGVADHLQCIIPKNQNISKSVTTPATSLRPSRRGRNVSVTHIVLIPLHLHGCHEKEFLLVPFQKIPKVGQLQYVMRLLQPQYHSKRLHKVHHIVSIDSPLSVSKENIDTRSIEPSKVFFFYNDENKSTGMFI